MALSFLCEVDIMSIENEAINVMVKEIYNLVKTMVSKSSFDRTKKGRVVTYLGNKYYEVQLDNKTYKAYSPTFTCDKNDIVYVKIAENNYNSLIIECTIK